MGLESGWYYEEIGRYFVAKIRFIGPLIRPEKYSVANSRAPWLILTIPVDLIST